MPDVRNCKKCGKIFNYIGGAPVCHVCRQLDEEDFKRVKEYLYENTGAALSVISNELNISVEKIRRFLKDGRLEIVGQDGNMFLDCESCGKSIKTGRLCDECEKNLASDLKTTAGQINQDILKSTATKDGGLRYLNKFDKDKR